MARGELWAQLTLGDRKGTFRGMEIGMPLREAIALESGAMTRGRDRVAFRESLDMDTWTEVEIRFARLKGLDRVTGMRFELATRRDFAAAESAFAALKDRLAARFGPPLPVNAIASARRQHCQFKVQGREVPTSLEIELTDRLDEDRLRTARLAVNMQRA